MTPIRLSARPLLILAAAAVLAACSPMHRGGGPGGMGGMGGGDSTQRCEMHRQMMAGKTPDEQRAAVEAHIRQMHGSVDQAHVDRHMQMMASRCGAPR